MTRGMKQARWFKLETPTTRVCKTGFGSKIWIIEDSFCVFVLVSFSHFPSHNAMRGFEFMFMTNPQVPYRVILTRLGQPVFWLETVRGLQHLFMCRFACLKHYQGLETRLGQMSHLFWTNVNILLQETSAQHSSENINRRSWYVFFYSHHLDVLLPVTLMQRRFRVRVWVLWLEPYWYWILSANANVV